MSGKTHSSNLMKCVGLALSVCLLAGNATMGLALAADSGVLTGDVRVTVNPANLRESLPIPGGSRTVTMALHDVDLKDAFRALAQKGGFNVLMDDSVQGTISVDLNNVTIQDALETFKSYGNLVYQVQGKNLVVAEATSDSGKALQKTTTCVFKLHNANAKVVADFLNRTVFADRMNNSGGSSASSSSSAGGSSSSGSSGAGASGNVQMPVMPDFNTNSIIVVGDPTDIKVVEEHLLALDQPRAMKTWRLSQANAFDVATALYSSLFNEGQPGLSLMSSSSSSSSGPVGYTPSSLRVTAESVTEGTGASQSAHAGGSGGGGSGQTTVVNSLNLRTRTQSTQMIQVSPTSAIVLPDTRMNTVTVLGTAEQIGMADSMIAVLDRKVPQVVLEAALLEISNTTSDQLGFSMGTNGGAFSTSSNNQGNLLGTGAIGPAAGNQGENILRLATHSLRTAPGAFYQFNALLSKNKVKMLANPTIITSSDNEAAVSIVDEILRSVTVNQASFGGPPTKTFNIGEAGIVLNILPKVGANKTISMRIRPIVTSVLGEKTDLNGNQVTLLSKRESLAQNVQVKDGETFVLGGLLHDTNTKTVLSNPLFSQLPIIGALARNTNNAKSHSELVIMITPHIVNEESELSQNGPILPGGGLQPANLSGNAGKSFGNGMVPVSFSGSSATSDSAIPPMAPAHPFNGATNGEDTADHDQAKPMHHRRSGSLLPAEMLPVPQQGLVKPKTSNLPKAETKASFLPANATSAGGSDLSDEKIQAIMNKFKSP